MVTLMAGINIGLKADCTCAFLFLFHFFIFSFPVRGTMEMKEGDCTHPKNLLYKWLIFSVRNTTM